LKTLFRAALLATATLAAPAFAQPPKPAALTPIAYTSRTLPNGLRVYAIRDTATPNVSVQVWYDVGSKDDPKDRSGFAHMFEHLMFKATRNLVPEQFDRLTEDVGGYNNASTDDDYTNYYEVVPANHLQRLLFAEADRMASLVVDPKIFASERDVVKEELRMRVLAQPYGKLFGLYYPMTAYSTHPYARPGIGSLENLDAATIDQVRAFHATYYRPDNAVLVVAGNFDPAQLDKWIDQYFAPIKRPNRPIPRVTVAEPARTKATSYTVYEANTPLPAVLISWHLPPDRDPDTPALQVLDAILATGESSRLYQSLVYRQGLAQSAQTFLDTKQGTGNLAAIAIIAGGKDVAAGEAALRAEIARLRDAPVTAAELAEAKNELLTAALKERETAEGKASVIAGSVLIDGAPDASDAQVAQVANVTAADVQRVARKYLNDNQSAAIRYLPASAGAKGDTIALAPTVQVADLVPPADIKVVTPAPAGERIMPPAPGPQVAAVLPEPQEFALPNGMKVIAVPKAGQPIVSALLVADGGGALDRPGAAGTASVTAEVMTKGTARYTATQLAAATEALGTSLSSNADRDSATLGMTARSEELAPALAILAEVATRPRFAAEELTRARAQAIDNAKLTLSDPGDIASLAAARAVFGDAAYGAPLEGTPASLAAIKPADLPATWHATWRPDRTTLILVGDVTAERARALATENFGRWQAPAAGAAARPGVPATAAAPRVVVVDMPDAGQAAVAVARPALARRDAAYYDALVANATLGMGLSSRLGTEIRVKRGLAYGASSSILARRDGGLAIATTQTKNPSAAEVVGLIVSETKRLGAEPAGAEELDARKAILTGSFGRTIETTAGIAGTLGQYVTQRVPLATLKDYPTRVNGVTAAAVQAAAARYLDPTSASIIVVGDAKQFLEPLRKLYPTLEVIPVANLNLDSPALK
jgi:zinc protease